MDLMFQPKPNIYICSLFLSPFDNNQHFFMMETSRKKNAIHIKALAQFNMNMKY